MIDGPSSTRRRQKSVRYYLPRSAGESDSLPKGFTDFYTDMFMKDVSLGIMPIGGDARRSEFSVFLTPPDPVTEEIIISGLRTRDYERALKSSLSEFFRLLAFEVCSMDRAVYEIVYIEDVDSRAVGFELVYIEDAQIISKYGRISQRVPKNVADRENVVGLIPLPKEDLVIFRAPDGLAKILRDTRVSLSQLNDLAMSSLATDAFRAKIPYDYGIHRRRLQIALAAATREVGWTASGLFRESILSYYEIHMHLVFERFKLQLREAFLATLNEAFSRIGSRLNFESRITISGLPTTQEIDRAMIELRSGSTAFTVLLEPFLRY